MPFDRFLIAPINTGLQTDLKPWLTMDDSFVLLDNCYVFRGRVTKRVGSLYMGDLSLTSRLRMQIGTTDSMTGNLTASIPGITVSGNYVPFLQGATGQAFSAGSVFFTVYQTGTPAAMYRTDKSVSTATFDTSTGASSTSGQVVIVGAPVSVPVYWYPGEPVLGLPQYESGVINNHPSYAFDPTYAYLYNQGWNRSGTGANPVWHDPTGEEENYFWTANWEAVTDNDVAMFVSNFQVTNTDGTATLTDDPIWTTPDGSNWSTFTPVTVASSGVVSNYILTARIIVAFKNRLVLLNTIENDNSVSVNLGSTSGGGAASGTVPGGRGAIGQYFIIGSQTYYVTSANGALTTTGGGSGTFDTLTGAYTFTGATGSVAINWYVSGYAGENSNYVNRCRFSHNGSPYAANAFLEPNVTYNPGSGNVFSDGAGYIDATTEEQIISAEFIKDRLIVYFERSTWELAYTGNEILPFVWQKINTELGSQSTFSTVPFDNEVITIGNTGIHSCTGANVVRIDQKIPDSIFDFKANETIRTSGIRDYFAEIVYWTYASDLQEETQLFPNQVLIYNYQNQSWASMDDCITTFGYFEQQEDTTWATAQGTWEQYSGSWIDGILQANERQIIAGNQQGYVVRLARDISSNIPNMQITNIAIDMMQRTVVTIYNHNLTSNPQLTAYDYDFVYITGVVADTATQAALNDKIFAVSGVMDANNIYIITGLETIADYYGGGLAGRVSNVQIQTKQFNPYVQTDKNVFIQRADFGVLKTESGQVTVDYFPSSTEVSMIEGGLATDAILGNNILETSPYDALYAPLEQNQELLWHPVYFQASGQFIQLFIYMSPLQMTSVPIAFSNFEIQGIILYTQSVGDRLQ
jgi:hypothetical protein